MSEIPPDHPRYASLMERHQIVESMHQHVVAESGLISHGRGEAFDYILGEKTPYYALKQERVAVAFLLTAKHPIISVNGNVAALCANELVIFAQKINATLEVNLFYRTEEREHAVANVLKQAGATTILGVNLGINAATIPEISSSRRIVDPEGIFKADVILVPLEDGDRTMALRKMGKTVISIDLNPLSRTSIWSTVTIVNHVKRALVEMTKIADDLAKINRNELFKIQKEFNNNKSLQESVGFMAERLNALSMTKIAQGGK